MSRVSGSIVDDVVRSLIHVEDGDEQRKILEYWIHASQSIDELARLKDESERQLTIDPRSSLRLARALVQGAELVERAELRALGLLATGDALRALGQCQDAVDAFDAAARSFRERKDEVGWARTRIGRLLALKLLGRVADGLADAETARDILVRHQQWLRAGALSINLGSAFSELARFDEAIDSYDRALEFLDQARLANPELGDTVELRLAKTLANKARVLRLRGDSRAALTFHEASRAVFARHGDTLSVLQENRNLAEVYAAQGHFSRALQLFEETVASLDRQGTPVDAAGTALDLAECYLRLNHVDRALGLAETAADRFDRSGLTTEAAKARYFWAVCLARRGEVPSAIRLLDEAARAFADAGLVVQLAHVTLQRGQVQLRAANYGAAVASARQARALFDERGLVVPRCQAELILAQALLGVGDLAAAESLGRAVLVQCDDYELDWLCHECHHVLASIARRRGDARAALREYRTAVGDVEQIQGRVATELRHYFLGDKARVFYDAIALSLQLGETELAFSFLERAKSRALVDYVAGNLDVRPPAPDATTRALLDELTQLRGEHNWLYEQIHGREVMQRAEATPASTGPTDAGRQALVAGLRDREKQITRLLERLDLQRAVSGATERHVEPEPESWIPAIADDAALIEYFFGPDGSTAFVVADGRIVAVRLAARERDVERLSGQWQLNLDATAAAIARQAPLEGLGRNARSILKAMHRALVEPVAKLIDQRSRLVIIPFGVTHAVPFQALYDGTRFLVECHEVVIAPSSELLRLCSARRRVGNRPALVVGHADGGRLSAVLDEARVVGSLFPGTSLLDREATIAHVTDAAGRSGLIHLAAHGEARLDNPTFAHLKLADGRLSTVDVFGLDLDGAVVVLSACETGRGVVVGGDELIGLSRGFLSAGAATVIQSMWRVEDGSTARLMGQFYRALQAGRAKGAALRDAQVELLRSGAAHPYFWAAFQLIGDSGAL